MHFSPKHSKLCLRRAKNLLLQHLSNSYRWLPEVLRSSCISPKHQNSSLNALSTPVDETETKKEKKKIQNKSIPLSISTSQTMALARLAFRNLQQNLSSSSLLGYRLPEIKGVSGSLQRQRLGGETLKRFLVTSTNRVSDEKNEGNKEVAVTEGGKKSRLFPRRRNKRSLWNWRNDRDFVPSLNEFFPSGLGNALMQATENINRLFDNLNLTPSQLMARVKEDEKHYKLRYDVPGLSKEDVKIAVDDGVLTIKGEHKEEDEEGSDDEYWAARSYGYYNTSLVLPEDAKSDDIKAELKDGVLSVTIPKTEKPKKEAKEVKIH